MRRLQSHKSDKILVKNPIYLLNNESIHQLNPNEQLKSKQLILQPNILQQSEYMTYQKKIPLK